MRDLPVRIRLLARYCGRHRDFNLEERGAGANNTGPPRQIMAAEWCRRLVDLGGGSCEVAGKNRADTSA
jgi:hypothetical protein